MSLYEYDVITTDDKTTLLFKHQKKGEIVKEMWLEYVKFQSSDENLQYDSRRLFSGRGVLNCRIYLHLQPDYNFFEDMKKRGDPALNNEIICAKRKLFEERQEKIRREKPVEPFEWIIYGDFLHGVPVGKAVLITPKDVEVKCFFQDGWPTETVFQKFTRTEAKKCLDWEATASFEYGSSLSTQSVKIINYNRNIVIIGKLTINGELHDMCEFYKKENYQDQINSLPYKKALYIRGEEFVVQDWLQKQLGNLEQVQNKTQMGFVLNGATRHDKLVYGTMHRDGLPLWEFKGMLQSYHIEQKDDNDLPLAYLTGAGQIKEDLPDGTTRLRVGEFQNDQLIGEKCLEKRFTRNKVSVPPDNECLIVRRGAFERGKLCGNGFERLQDGTELSGQFLEGKLEGQGGIKMSNGLYQFGYFQGGQAVQMHVRKFQDTEWIYTSGDEQSGYVGKRTRDKETLSCDLDGKFDKNGIANGWFLYSSSTEVSKKLYKQDSPIQTLMIKTFAPCDEIYCLFEQELHVLKDYQQQLYRGEKATPSSYENGYFDMSYCLVQGMRVLLFPNRQQSVQTVVNRLKIEESIGTDLYVLTINKLPLGAAFDPPLRIIEFQHNYGAWISFEGELRWDQMQGIYINSDSGVLYRLNDRLTRQIAQRPLQSVLFPQMKNFTLLEKKFFEQPGKFVNTKLEGLGEEVSFAPETIQNVQLGQKVVRIARGVFRGGKMHGPVWIRECFLDEEKSKTVEHLESRIRAKELELVEQKKHGLCRQMKCSQTIANETAYSPRAISPMGTPTLRKTYRIAQETAAEQAESIEQLQEQINQLQKQLREIQRNASGGLEKVKYFWYGQEISEESGRNAQQTFHDWVHKEAENVAKLRQLQAKLSLFLQVKSTSYQTSALRANECAARQNAALARWNARSGLCRQFVQLGRQKCQESRLQAAVIKQALSIEAQALEAQKRQDAEREALKSRVKEEEETKKLPGGQQVQLNTPTSQVNEASLAAQAASIAVQKKGYQQQGDRNASGLDGSKESYESKTAETKDEAKLRELEKELQTLQDQKENLEKLIQDAEKRFEMENKEGLSKNKLKELKKTIFGTTRATRDLLNGQINTLRRQMDQQQAKIAQKNKNK